MSLFDSVQHTIFDLNGFVVEGWSEDEDALMLPDVELFTVERGGDGMMIAHATANRGGEVTIKLLATSTTTQYLMQQVAQILKGAEIVFQATMINLKTNQSVLFERGVLKTAPLGPSVGKSKAQNREFVFEFESITPNYDGAIASRPPPITSI